MADHERPLRLLSLDGGGIRGLSSLYILRNILVAAQKSAMYGSTGASDSGSPRPCDYFDMIGGTSTGGLIAVMLGVLRMDINTCIDAYVKMAREIFPQEGRLSASKFWKGKKAAFGENRFETAPLEAAIKSLVKEKLGNGATGNEMLRSQSSQGCKVFVCVTSGEPRAHFRFRSYESTQVPLEDVAIWEACRATSAAPTFFAPMEIGNLRTPYLDGGLGYNNPIRALLDEVPHVWPSRSIGSIVSIGTGLGSLKDVGTSLKLLETLKDMATDTERVAGEIQNEMNYRGFSEKGYFRFNVNQGLEVVGLEEWKQMSRVKTVTEGYLQREGRRVDLCANQLVAPTITIELTILPRHPQSFSTIPFPQDDHFVGREDILAQLGTAFDSARRLRWASLSGLGGIGKSQIAIEYSYRLRNRSRQISTFWVHASSKVRFDQSYTEIATAVGIKVIGNGDAETLRLVLDWLSDNEHGSWLLILDNADDSTVLLDPLTPNDIGANERGPRRRLLDYVPRVQHGTVLITSRDQTCAMQLVDHCGTPIEVRSMDLDDSIELLRTRMPDVSEEEATELVSELENVPLAITQAGAYLKELSQLVSIPAYLAKFRSSEGDQAALLNRNTVDLRRDPGVPNAVLTAWELSFVHIREKNPASTDLLSLMSYFNRQAIPQFLIQGQIDELLFLENIKLLVSFSLVRAEKGDRTFEIHRLVQIATRHWLESEHSEQRWKKRALARLKRHWPLQTARPNYMSICKILMPHADEIIPHKTSSRESELIRAEVLLHTCRFLNQGNGYAALGQQQRSLCALEIQQRYLEDDSEEVLISKQSLASAYYYLEPSKAVDIQETILEHRLKIHGRRNSDTMSAMRSLALSYQETGQVDRAFELLKSAIEANECTLGSESGGFVDCLDTMARNYIYQGKYDEAKKVSVRVLNTTTRVYGVEHVNTFDAMRSLFVISKFKGSHQRAEGLITEVILGLTKTLDPRHWKVLQARVDLAEIYSRQLRFEEAKQICVQCVDLAQKSWGPQHQTTLYAMEILSFIYGSLGDFSRASNLLEQCLDVHSKVYRFDHRGSLTCSGNLAQCYYHKGDKSRAIQMMTDVAQKRRIRLSANHPETLHSEELLSKWEQEVNMHRQLGSASISRGHDHN